MSSSNILDAAFFQRDVLEVAPALLGKKLVRILADGRRLSLAITEVEAYRGEDDLACHARKGRTPRTEVMYWEGGYIYVYLIYGMYDMLNFVCAYRDEPQAVLIRGVEGISGPGRLTKALAIDKQFHEKRVDQLPDLWLEDAEPVRSWKTDERVGIDYAGDFWKSKPWRFSIK